MRESFIWEMISYLLRVDAHKGFCNSSSLEYISRAGGYAVFHVCMYFLECAILDRTTVYSTTIGHTATCMHRPSLVCNTRKSKKTKTKIKYPKV